MEKCPGGTSESVVLLRHNVERKQEEDARGVGMEDHRKEDADEQRGERQVHGSDREINDARKDREETRESRALTESEKDGSGRVQLWNPTTCHVPGGTWLEQVEDPCGIGKKDGRKEDADGQRGKDECTEATGRSRTARKDGEETRESRAPTESEKNGSGRVQLWNLTTSHVPGGTWLERVRARIRALSTFWVYLTYRGGTEEEENEKGKGGRKYNINFSERQGEYL
ncbi:hypothetical protein NDU88_005138 [Pleurodeles waltl]|uniref:Uncharacterized protein n=1 Tax=Pleurodeles waltl TaxID=8319 RepID=A0AAV7MAC4_PLEWA|nr:hypothetical protein NDU88_005138 [Pleurodeles waltl]